ncbi:MAG TPA: hypothetical protein VJK08_00925, partial [Patescibacteria group bacterium]|nr:hypothetical protein [Patescibacteria group bacterium]
YREVYPSFELPGWVEGPIVAIRTGFFSDNYGEELEEVLKALKKARDGKLYNCREGQLGAEYLRQSERTQAKLRVLTERQWGSDLLILPAQLGIRHRGRSVRRARETMSASEFGLGSAITGTAILTNPIRLTQYDDLWIDCAGDEYSPDADGVFGGAPCFDLGGGKVEFEPARSSTAATSTARPRASSRSSSVLYPGILESFGNLPLGAWILSAARRSMQLGYPRR